MLEELLMAQSGIMWHLFLIFVWLWFFLFYFIVSQHKALLKVNNVCLHVVTSDFFLVIRGQLWQSWKQVVALLSVGVITSIMANQVTFCHSECGLHNDSLAIGWQREMETFLWRNGCSCVGDIVSMSEYYMTLKASYWGLLNYCSLRGENTFGEHEFLLSQESSCTNLGNGSMTWSEAPKKLAEVVGLALREGHRPGSL